MDGSYNGPLLYIFQLHFYKSPSGLVHDRYLLEIHIILKSENGKDVRSLNMKIRYFDFDNLSVYC